MSNGRATEAQLDALHGLLTDALAEELRRAKEAAEGPDGKPIPHQLIDKVIKFLGLNGVDTPKAAPRKDTLAAELMDLDLDEIAAQRPN